MTDKKTFPLEKILNISYETYEKFNPIDTCPISSEYIDLVGINLNGSINIERTSIIEKFASVVPSNALAVVNYNTFINYNACIRESCYVASGVAVVPNERGLNYIKMHGKKD